jgi:threonine synthase
MNYVSTRSQANSTATFEDVLLGGLARDGGLYVPTTWPGPRDPESLAGLDYAALAARVMTPYTAGCLDESALLDHARSAYAGFNHPATAPLVQLSSGLWLMELFHGPTLAFKDFALQLVGRLFDDVLARRGEKLTIVGATSGDTGSAAIEACRGRENLSVIILHPHGRVSEVQRRQMTTVGDMNVHNVAIDGTFDDCQALVKAMFNDLSFRDEMRLGAINSINWGRIVAQTVYYWYAGLALGAPHRPVAFSVPTGNFGNVFAGWAAMRSGLPVEKFMVATNRNDILARFFRSGAYEKGGVVSSVSPSMDIQVASNFERLLFDLFDETGARVGALMDDLDTKGGFGLDAAQGAATRATFVGESVDDDRALETIASTYRDTGTLIDPHTAAGVAVAKSQGDQLRHDGVPVVCLATAHPAKFPDAVERATGVRPPLPAHLADLYDRTEHVDRLPVDLQKVQAFVRTHGAVGGTG